MATFISVPLKKSSEVDLVKPLSKFVTMTYPTGDEQTEYVREQAPQERTGEAARQTRQLPGDPAEV